MPDPLKHTKQVQSLIDKGKLIEAAEVHNRHLKAELERATSGEVIELTDLMAAKEALELVKATVDQRSAE